MTSQTPDLKLSAARQSLIGLTLAAAIIGGWLVLHVYAMFFYTFSEHSWVTAPLLAACIAWLYVGIFIVAHDCMHGSLAPFRPRLNQIVGQICVFLYAGFHFRALNRKHHLHHRNAGLADDPDFHEAQPDRFWAWYMRFFREYFSWRELLIIAVATNVYMFILGVPVVNVLMFWALPAIVSSVQLFTFGTYLPHRPGATPFPDRHRARSNRYGWWLSLLTCFHFGYHHEHHELPDLPWWRLPAAHAAHGMVNTSAGGE